MSPKLTKEAGEPTDVHKLSKMVGGPEQLNPKATSESLDSLQPSTAPVPPAKLHRGRAKQTDEPSEKMQSTPLTSHEQRPQTTPARPVPAKLSRSTAMNFNDPAIAAQIAGLALNDESSLAYSPQTSFQAPFIQPGASSVGSRGRYNRVKSGQSHENGNSLRANKISNSKLQKSKEPQQGHVPTDQTSPMQQPFPSKPAKKMRYYSWALSKEDKQALTAGEKEHNSKQWSGEDLVRLHESRLGLVPRGLEDRDTVIEGIKKEKENAERYLSRADRLVGRFKIPRLSLSPSVTQSPITKQTQHSQNPQSSSELRVSSSPQPLASLTPIPSPQISPSPPASPLELRERPPTRKASAGDYFSRPVARRPGRPLSQPFSRHHSDHTSYVRSPLSNQLVFESRPEVTFDSFLEPHASGKGEAYRGADNAKKDDSPGEGGASIELKPVNNQTKKLSIRLRKMSSMPSLRVHKTRDDPDSGMGK